MDNKKQRLDTLSDIPSSKIKKLLIGRVLVFIIRLLYITVWYMVGLLAIHIVMWVNGVQGYDIEGYPVIILFAIVMAYRNKISVKLK